MTPDELDDLLTPHPPAGDGRREELFARTAAVLRQRLWLRRFGLVLLGVGLFAAGWFAKPTPEPETITVTVPVPQPVPVEPREPAYAPPPTAARLELDAELAETPAASAKLYKRAADQFLAEKNIAAAARCYALHLAAAPPADRAADANDSWLLLELKAARRAANPGGNGDATVNP